MTDEELVKRLRNFDDGATPTHEAADRIEALTADLARSTRLISKMVPLSACGNYVFWDGVGDIELDHNGELRRRIKALTVERDEAWRRAGHAEEQWGRCEVKFSKAVWLLGKHCDTWAMNDFDAETLAELLGDKG